MADLKSQRELAKVRVALRARLFDGKDARSALLALKSVATKDEYERWSARLRK